MLNYSTYLWKNPQDEQSTPMAYGRVQSNKTMTFEEFVQHISEHNGVFSAGTVQGVVTDTVACLLEMLLNGNKVQFGRLGTFGVQISCQPAESLEMFSAQNIKSVNLQFIPGKDFENMRDKAEFNLVTSRAVQAATLKAVKAGEKSVELPTSATQTETQTQYVDPSDPVVEGEIDSGSIIS